MGQKQQSHRVAVTLEELAAAPQRATTLCESQVTELVAKCAVANAALLARLVALQHVQVEKESPDRLLTVADVVQRLKLKPPYIYELARRGLLPAVKVGKYVRFPESSLAMWERGRISETIKDERSVR
jgi:excisionase family DNA binding protein